MAATGLASGLAQADVRLALGAVLVAFSDLAVARQCFGEAAFVKKLIDLVDAQTTARDGNQQSHDNLPWSLAMLRQNLRVLP